MGKKKGGNDGINYGMYNFEDGVEIYFFADLEGNMPKEIKELININDDESGTQIKLNKNHAIVFTGDLIDRGEKSIRNLKNMLKLKTENKTRVVLTCGNRDLNKIRCYQEFAVDAIKKILMKKYDKTTNLKTPAEIFTIIINEYININTEGYNDLNDFTFTNSSIYLEEFVNVKGIWTKYGQTPEGEDAQNESELLKFTDVYTNDLKERVNYIYANTFGSPNQVDFFKKEFEELFGIYSYYSKNAPYEREQLNENDFYNKYIHLIIITMNMIMGKRWDNDHNNIDERLIDVFNDYKGLYIRYLEKCHIMSNITIGNKLIITSHSGIPYDDTMKRFIIPRDIGKSSADDLNEINIENIVFLNSELTKFLTDFNQYFNNKPDNINTDSFKENFKENFKKYIAMTGSCLDECNKRIKDDGQKTIKSQFSPVVGIHSLNDRGPLKYRGKPIILDCRFNKYNKIYHIFGHQPAGLLPSFSTAENEQNTQITYHIDLDISKAENTGGTSNSKSYAYLKITKDEHRFVGKTNAINKIIYNLIKEKEEKTEDINKIIYLIKEEEKKTEDIKEEEKTDGISLDYYISLDAYDIKYETYKVTIKDKVTEKDKTYIYDIIFHSVDNITYYGMCSQNFQLLKYVPKNDPINNGGRSNKYKKSEKRFINGKRKMVIYTGKRRGEYVKVKGVFISLAKYKKILSNKAAKKTK